MIRFHWFFVSKMPKSGYRLMFRFYFLLQMCHDEASTYTILVQLTKVWKLFFCSQKKISTLQKSISDNWSWEEVEGNFRKLIFFHLKFRVSNIFSYMCQSNPLFQSRKNESFTFFQSPEHFFRDMIWNSPVGHSTWFSGRIFSI